MISALRHETSRICEVSRKFTVASDYGLDYLNKFQIIHYCRHSARFKYWTWVQNFRNISFHPIWLTYTWHRLYFNMHSQLSRDFGLGWYGWLKYVNHLCQPDYKSVFSPPKQLSLPNKFSNANFNVFWDWSRFYLMLLKGKPPSF